MVRSDERNPGQTGHLTTRVDASVYWSQAWRAVRCHQTQLRYPSRLDHLSEQDHRYLWGTQEYYRVFSLVNSGRQEEQDLFEGFSTSPSDRRSRTPAGAPCPF
jgi:hypothetical protein